MLGLGMEVVQGLTRQSPWHMESFDNFKLEGILQTLIWWPPEWYGKSVWLRLST